MFLRSARGDTPMYGTCFFIWRLLLILIRENPLLGPLEGVGPDNLDFLAQMVLASFVANSWPKKSRLSGPIPSSDPRDGFSRYVPRHINNRYICTILGSVYLHFWNICPVGLDVEKYRYLLFKEEITSSDPNGTIFRIRFVQNNLELFLHNLITVTWHKPKHEVPGYGTIFF